MSRIERDILIRRPPAAVYDFLSAAENHARFIPGMREFQSTSPGPFGRVGATARGLRSDFGLRSAVTYEITAVQPGTQLAMRGAMGPLGFHDGYILEPAADGTRVRFWLELQLRGLFALARPFVDLIGRVHADETLANLKKAIETAA